jgi:hypothetical protein
MGRRGTGLDGSRIWMGRIRGGHCEKIQIRFLLGSGFFGFKSSMGLTRRGGNQTGRVG